MPGKSNRCFYSGLLSIPVSMAVGRYRKIAEALHPLCLDVAMVPPKLDPTPDLAIIVLCRNLEQRAVVEVRTARNCRVDYSLRELISGKMQDGMRYGLHLAYLNECPWEIYNHWGLACPDFDALAAQTVIYPPARQVDGAAPP